MSATDTPDISMYDDEPSPSTPTNSQLQDKGAELLSLFDTVKPESSQQESIVPWCKEPYILLKKKITSKSIEIKRLLLIGMSFSTKKDINI
jgi:hypothetical protein